LEWYKNGVLEKELGMETKLPDFFKVPKVFIEDLEKWYGLFCGLGQIKRIQSPPIVTISRRPYGFDWREAVLKPYYGKKFVDLRRELIEKESI
jgi:NAD+ synthase (glutamine-hydrolysing)